ncbi:MAG: MarR family winged helix-turn-helix transcriptional regulator [Candidatus Kapaibacteriota bacterium]|jgi:DNA-binding MarR family transcriptional regulator
MNNPKKCNKDNNIPFSGCLFFASNSMARNTTNLAEIAFKPLGISAPSAYIIMFVLKQPGINATDLAKSMMLKPSTVSRFLDRLIANNYLRKETESKYVYVYPTEFSKELLPKLEECSNKLMLLYSEVFPQEDICAITKTAFDSSIKIEKYLKKLR